MTSTAAYFLLLLAVIVAMLRYPAAALAMVICQYALEQWAQGSGGLLSAIPWLGNVATGCLVLLGLTLLFLRGRLPFPIPTIAWVTYALFGLSVLTYFWALHRDVHLDYWRQSAPYILTIVVLAPWLVGDWSDARAALFATLCVGSLSLLLLAFFSDRIGRTIAVELYGSRGNPLAIASLAGHMVIVAVLMNFRGVARVWQLLRWGVVAIGIYVLVLSESRGQFFAMLIAAGLFLPVSRRFGSVRGLVLALVGLTAIGAVAFWMQQQFATEQRWMWEEMTVTYGDTRIGMAGDLLQHWLDSGPLRWVIGLGSSASYTLIGFYPHLVMAEVLAEEGLIGLVLLWLVPILGFRAIWLSYRVVREDAALRGVLATLGALFLFEVVLSFKQGSLLGSQYAFMFAIILGRLELATRQGTYAGAIGGAPVLWQQQTGLRQH